MKKIILNLVALFLITAASLNAQSQDIVLTAMPVVGQVNSTVSVDIKVENWTDIAGAQWSMHWDDTVLSYASVSNYSLPGEVEGSFGTPPSTESNTLTFSWFDDTVQGVTLEPNTVLFTINFNVIGAQGAVSTITFDGVPTAVEVVNPSLDILNVDFGEGTVTVDNSSAIETIHTRDFALHNNMPNPFKTETNIVLDLNSDSKTTLSIYTVTGKLLFEQNYNLIRGSNTIPVSADVFPAAGTYVYRVATENSNATRKMTLID